MAPKYFLLLTVFFVVGCATTPRGVDWFSDKNCQLETLDATSYAVSAVDMPGFIEPAILFTVHQSMQRMGLRLTEDADLHIQLRFEQVSLGPEPMVRDGFDESLAPGPITRFNAIVHVQVKTRSGNLVWSGALNRAHAITGSETFHTDIAIGLLQEAFDELFENLFQPCS